MTEEEFGMVLSDALNKALPLSLMEKNVEQLLMSMYLEK